jgi:hypothetical protein
MSSFNPAGALLLLAAAGAPLAAQRRELAVLAGPNLSGATGDAIFRQTSHAGFYAGMSLRLPRSPQVAVQTDLTLVQRNLYAERAPSTLDPLLVGPFSDDARLTYAQLGIQARIQRGYSMVQPVRPYLTLGPYAAVIVHCTHRIVSATGEAATTGCGPSPGASSPGVSPFPAVYQNVDVGLTGAVGVEIRRLVIGVRGERSFRNLVETGAIPTSPFDQSRAWSVGLVGEFMVRVM